VTEFKPSNRDVNRVIRSWLREDRHEDVSRVAGAVLDQLDTMPQRRARWWPVWRTPNMNKLVTYGLGAAAVVAVLFVGAQFVGTPSGFLGADPTPTPTPQMTATPEPTPPSDGSLPEGGHDLWSRDLGVTISVMVSTPGWFGEPGEGTLIKNDNADAPDGAGLIVFAQTNDLLVGLGDLYVYGDPCHWESTKPDTPVTTVDEAIAALSAQASRDPSRPADVTLDGYSGKRITLHVPDDAMFSDCDRGEFRTLVEGQESARYHQDPGQIDLLWILDVNGELVILDIAYYEGTPESVLDEIAAIVESATLDYRP
jgi:hypothetical protein